MRRARARPKPGLCLLLVTASLGCSEDPLPGPMPAPGGSAAPTAVSTAAPNRPPTVSITAAEPARALWRVTRVSLAATAVDPDGDSLRYAWDFGDGAVETAGAGVGHVFDEAGQINVTVTVDDARGGTATARRTVAVETLSGAWHGLLSHGPNGGLRIGGRVTQTGRQLHMTMSTHNGDGTGNSRDVDVNAVFYDPRDMAFTVALCGGVTYRGSWNESFDAFIADGDGCGPDYRRLEFYR